MSKAKNYGEAFHSLAKDENIAKELLADLKQLSALFKEHPDYVKILDSPQIPRQTLMRILNEDFFGRVHRYTLNFLKLLSQKHLVHCLHECLREYERLYNKDNNITTVHVTTARPMNKSVAERLLKKLEEKTGGKILLIRKVDQGCIGGIIIKTEDMLIDSSVKRELDNLKQSLVS